MKESKHLKEIISEKKYHRKQHSHTFLTSPVYNNDSKSTIDVSKNIAKFRSPSQGSKNVNDFLHVIKDNKSFEDTLSWISKLRNPVKINIPDQYIPHAYVSDKKKIRINKTRDISYSGNAADIWHLLKPKPFASKNQIAFETSLREYKRMSINPDSEPLIKTKKEINFDTNLKRQTPDFIGIF